MSLRDYQLALVGTEDICRCSTKTEVSAIEGTFWSEALHRLGFPKAESLPSGITMRCLPVQISAGFECRPSRGGGIKTPPKNFAGFVRIGVLHSNWAIKIP